MNPKPTGVHTRVQDDLDDARWKTDFSWTVPEGLKSGAYAMRLNCSSHQDTIPFFVLPPKGQTQVGVMELHRWRRKLGRCCTRRPSLMCNVRTRRLLGGTLGSMRGLLWVGGLLLRLLPV